MSNGANDVETMTALMTAERIADLYEIVHDPLNHNSDGKINLDPDDLGECLDEIERLRACLQHMHDDPLSTRYTLRHQAWQALNGYTVGDGR